ncbi:MAG TPA: BTAD domain-containing putative transcriptional regulator [Actinomycetota bacterium]|nr:BTAD domain-containing putative transcriptional regulator [Actinomycetota bacterium]
MSARDTDIHLLGRFAVCVDGDEVPPAAFAGRLVRTLIRLLLASRGSSVPRDAVVEALWPGRVPVDPGANVDVLVSRARRALQDPGLIVATSGGLCFVHAAGCRVDAEAFLARVRAGQEAAASGAWPHARGEFQAALDGWGGEPLPEDVYADWAQGYRRELQRAHLDALEGAAEAGLACGQPGRAVVFAEQAVGREPIRERATLLLAEALAASGDQAGALGALRSLRERLADELGVDPSAGVAELELRLLRAGGALPVPTVTRVPRIVAGAGSPGRLRWVGRSEELALVLGALASPGAVVQVAGLAGSGKSRLLAEVQARLALPALVVRAFLPEADEAWSLARGLMAEALALNVTAARDLPVRMQAALAQAMPGLDELQGGEGAAVSAETLRALAQEGAVRLLGAACGPDAVVLIDDLQWADPTSAALLNSLIVRVPQVRWILAYRPEEIPADGPLGDLLGHPAHRQVVLGALPAQAVGELASDPMLAQLLVGETDATPFTLAEGLRSLAEEGLVVADREGRWSLRSATAVDQARTVVIGGQRRSILARVRGQAPRRRGVLVLMALLGREAPAGLLAQATGQPQATVLADLDTLAGAGLARFGDGGWAAAHDLIAEGVRQSLSPGEAARLHATLAEALGREGAEPAERAAHLRAAGQAAPAVEAYAAAGRAALGRHAVDEADSLASTGLELATAPRDRTELLRIRAEARAHRGDLGGARSDLTEAIAATRSGPDRARRMARLAMLTSGASDLARAADLIDRAVLEAAGDPGARAEALYVGAVVDMNAGAPERATRRFDEALALYEQAGEPLGVANVLDGRAMGAVMAGRIADGAEALGRAARLFADSGELARVIWPLAGRGAALAWMLRGDEGLSDVAEALEIARELAHPEAEAYCRLEESLVMASLGRAGEAESAASAALAIAEGLGHAEWTAGALLALGGAQLSGGDAAAAVGPLRRCQAMAAERHLPHFAGWAAALLARALVALGDRAEAGEMIARALATEVPFCHFYARWAQAELAVARGDPDAAEQIRSARELAVRGGHLESAAALERLTPPPQTP